MTSLKAATNFTVDGGALRAELTCFAEDGGPEQLGFWDRPCTWPRYGAVQRGHQEGNGKSLGASEGESKMCIYRERHPKWITSNLHMTFKWFSYKLFLKFSKSYSWPACMPMWSRLLISFRGENSAKLHTLQSAARSILNAERMAVWSWLESLSNAASLQICGFGGKILRIRGAWSSVFLWKGYLLAVLDTTIWLSLKNNSRER